MATLKQLAERPDRLTSGHRACAGCGFPVVAKLVLKATEDPVVVANATGCMEVTTSIYPYTAWDTNWIHSAFENAAATISGVEAAYRGLKRKGKIEDKKVKFVAFGGDGGTYDIGFQSLSGAMERGHDIVYVCYDNQAYMNTGIQRSSATPLGSDTTTTPAGKVVPGKPQFPKDLTAIMAAHDIPYVAQASLWRWNDIVNKAQKAFEVEGPAFLNIFSTCPLGWRFDPAMTQEVAKLATDSCVWPLYEVENGEWKLTYKPRQKVPVIEYLKTQGRFRHLLKPENKELVERIQEEVDRRWQRLLERCGESE